MPTRVMGIKVSALQLVDYKYSQHSVEIIFQIVASWKENG